MPEHRGFAINLMARGPDDSQDEDDASPKPRYYESRSADDRREGQDRTGKETPGQAVDVTADIPTVRIMPGQCTLSNYESKVMPDSMKSKIKEYSPDVSAEPKKKSGQKTNPRGSIIDKIAQVFPSVFSPKRRSSNQYSSLQKQKIIEPEQVIMDIQSQRKIDEEAYKDEEKGEKPSEIKPLFRNNSGARYQDIVEDERVDQEAMDEKDEDEMQKLLGYLEQFGPDVAQGFILRMVSLFQSNPPQKEDWDIEINAYLLELVAEGKIDIGQGEENIQQSVESISVPMVFIMHTLQESKAITKASFESNMMKLALKVSKRNSEYFKPLYSNLDNLPQWSQWTSLNNKLVPCIEEEVSPEASFKQASNNIEAFICLMVSEVNSDVGSDFGLNSTKYDIMIQNLKDIKQLYCSSSDDDGNDKLLRDNLLFTPRLTLMSPKPRHNVVYYKGDYVPLQEKKAYRWSNLFRPVRALVSKLNKLSKSKEKSIDDSSVPEALPFEMPADLYAQFKTLTVNFGIELCLASFSTISLETRLNMCYSSELNKDRPKIERLRSFFVDKILRNCLLPSSYLNLDLTQYKVYLVMVENIIKLQYMTLMRRLLLI